MKKDFPIGFFDSGVGGLSVFSRFRKILPNENVIYYGDLKNPPCFSARNRLFQRKYPLLSSRSAVFCRSPFQQWQAEYTQDMPTDQ